MDKLTIEQRLDIYLKAKETLIQGSTHIFKNVNFTTINYTIVYGFCNSIRPHYPLPLDMTILTIYQKTNPNCMRTSDIPIMEYRKIEFKQFPELIKHFPKIAYSNTWLFPTDKEGLQKRIDIYDKCIETLTKLILKLK